jgi:peroxiredoxin
MNRLTVGERSPDFSLPDQNGVMHSLLDINQSQNVLLAFNMGFI